MHKAQIQLKTVKFPVVNMQVNEYIGDMEQAEVSYGIKVAHKFDREVSSQIFGLRLIIEIEAQNGIKINLESHSEFIVDIDITEEFMSSHFARINAPAIVYPFVRAFITNLTVNGGYPPIILPAVNFQKLAEEQSEEQKEE